MSQQAKFSTDLQILKDRFESMQPELVETVRDPEMGVEGYVVVWNTEIAKGGKLEGAGKGGTRITPDLTLDQVKRLARTMALKNAAAGLPMGGAKSGLKADPKAPDFEIKYRRFVRLCAPFLLENGGSYGGFGFDIGGQPIHAMWACDELNSTRCFTGKPLDMGGTDYDREGLAGLGVSVAAQTLLDIKGKSAKGATFAVQGTGAMGAAVIRYFSEMGGVLMVFSDPLYEGTWVLKKTPSPALIAAMAKRDTPTVRTLIKKEAKKLSDDCQDVLYQDIDVLFPCAVQDVITATNVDQVKAKFISEGANNPTSAEAYPMIFQRGIALVPDFIANAGGIIAAYVELTSTASGVQKVKEAKDTTRERIAANVRALYDLVDTLNVEPSQAGQYMALKRILG